MLVAKCLEWISHSNLELQTFFTRLHQSKEKFKSAGPEEIILLSWSQALPTTSSAWGVQSASRSLRLFWSSNWCTTGRVHKEHTHVHLHRLPVTLGGKCIVRIPDFVAEAGFVCCVHKAHHTATPSSPCKEAYICVCLCVCVCVNECVLSAGKWPASMSQCTSQVLFVSRRAPAIPAAHRPDF